MDEALDEPARPRAFAPAMLCAVFERVLFITGTPGAGAPLITARSPTLARLAMMRRDRRTWNWNIQHHRVVLAAIPPAAVRALDVGCGDGLLAFDLADHGLQVVGIDVDAPSIERARANARGEHAEFIVGDLFDDSFDPQSFDVVAAISMLHHVDATKGLQRMRDLVRPGGVLVIVGFARPSNVADRLRAVAGGAYGALMRLRGLHWEHHAPTVWPPPCTMNEMQDLATVELPGAQFRRLLPSRYAIIWPSR